MMLCTCETNLSKFPKNSDLASTRSSLSSGFVRQNNARLPSVGKASQAPLRVLSAVNHTWNQPRRRGDLCCHDLHHDLGCSATRVLFSRVVFVRCSGNHQRPPHVTVCHRRQMDLPLRRLRVEMRRRAPWLPSAFSVAFVFEETPTFSKVKSVTFKRPFLWRVSMSGICYAFGRTFICYVPVSTLSVFGVVRLRNT